MVKDKFKYCFELVEAEKVPEYYHTLLALAKRLGCSQKGIYHNIAEALALIYLNALGNDCYSLEAYLQSFT
jgi:hypothetical protein